MMISFLRVQTTAVPVGAGVYNLLHLDASPHADRIGSTYECSLLESKTEASYG